jgi:hypothetical protein
VVGGAAGSSIGRADQEDQDREEQEAEARVQAGRAELQRMEDDEREVQRMEDEERPPEPSRDPEPVSPSEGIVGRVGKRPSR